ncbi:Ribonucleoside-diphosphate reductase small chain A, partial [Mucuna pruriens]
MENVHSEMYSLLLDTYTHYLHRTVPTDTKTLQEDRDFILGDGEFFAIGDDIIFENLASRLMNKVQVPEARAFYSFQIAMENVHSECTAFCLIPTSKTLHKKVDLFHAIANIPFIAIFRKAFVPSFGAKTPFHWERTR